MSAIVVDTLMDSLKHFPTCNVSEIIGKTFEKRWRASQLV